MRDVHISLVSSRAPALAGALSSLVGSASAASAVALVVMLVASLTELIARKLGAPTRWSTDVSVYGVLVLTFLGVAAAERRSEHVNADFFVVGRGPRVRRVAEGATRVTSLLFVLLLVWQGWNVAAGSLALGREIVGQFRVPAFALELLLPIGCLLLALEQIRGLVLFARGRSTGPAEPTEAAEIPL